MQKLLLLCFGFLWVGFLKAQKVDSIYFHPYTDSLKRGTFNYINIDGKLSDGRWLPLSNKEIEFISSAGKFSGNSLFIDTSFKDSKVKIKAVLKENPAIWQEFVLYIKTTVSNERLKTTEELLEEWKNKAKSKKRN